MDARAPSPAPLPCDLPTAWACTPAWRVLDTQFKSGQSFLATWRLWRDDPNRPKTLHFVGFSAVAPTKGALASQSIHAPTWQPLLDELEPHWFGLLPGFHRISLDEGRVLLTLCVGNRPELLRQQHFFADTVYLSDLASDGHAAWDVWAIKALTRCCRRGTRLSLRHGDVHLRAVLVQCGFVFDSRAEPSEENAVFDPHWPLKQSRSPTIHAATLPGTCAIVGAGLAGASVATSIARRGWKVVILDRGATPASGASGLPVGLVAPHGSIDDCKLSRLTRAGVRLMLGEAARFLEQGQDWALTGSIEYRIDGSQGLPAHWPMEGSEWSRSASPAGPENVPSIWHARSAWIKPAQLVRAWLSMPNITFQPDAQVTSLIRANDKWSLLDAQGQQLASADRVVFANAMGAFPLLQQAQATRPEWQLQLDRLPALQGVRGQLSFGRHADNSQAAFPHIPINGAGSVIPQIPTPDGLTWYIGSSFQSDTQPAYLPEQNHWANFERLQKLKPDLAEQLKPQFNAHNIQHWGETRCVTADRLPIVGALGDPLETGLWVCAGMGSRGLSFSVLCAELLAAEWAGEPLPIEFNLAQSFHALRAARPTKA